MVMIETTMTIGCIATILALIPALAPLYIGLQNKFPKPISMPPHEA